MSQPVFTETLGLVMFMLSWSIVYVSGRVYYLNEIDSFFNTADASYTLTGARVEPSSTPM